MFTVLFCGYLIPANNIPDFWIWVSYAFPRLSYQAFFSCRYMYSSTLTGSMHYCCPKVDDAKCIFVLDATGAL